MKLQMAAELTAVLAQSILEIVREMSYEEVNIGISGFSRTISVNCTHTSSDIVG